jgi:hypothetical protein
VPRPPEAAKRTLPLAFTVALLGESARSAAGAPSSSVLSAGEPVTVTRA